MKLAPLLGWLLGGLTPLATAVPHVAYIGNVGVHSTSAETAIMVLDLAGGEPVNVSEGLHAARAPAWSPDGAKLAFEALEDGLNDIIASGPDAAELTNVTATPDVWEASPCFVGADRLAYLAGPDRSDLWLVDLPTRKTTRLTQQPLFYRTPSASPDGRALAVTGSEKLAGPGHIYLVRTGGSATARLTPAPAIYSRPAFAPDGKSIAFCFDGVEIGGATRGLAIMPAIGGEPRLLAGDGYPLAALCFSPDGEQIAYTSSSTYHDTWVTVINVDGSDSTRLGVGRAHIIAWPSYLPDGKALAFQGVYAAVYTIRVIDLETGEERSLSEAGIRGVNPTVSPR